MNQKKISKQFLKTKCCEDSVLGPGGIHHSRWTWTQFHLTLLWVNNALWSCSCAPPYFKLWSLNSAHSAFPRSVSPTVSYTRSKIKRQTLREIRLFPLMEIKNLYLIYLDYSSSCFLFLFCEQTLCPHKICLSFDWISSVCLLFQLPKESY